MIVLGVRAPKNLGQDHTQVQCGHSLTQHRANGKQMLGNTISSIIARSLFGIINIPHGPNFAEPDTDCVVFSTRSDTSQLNGLEACKSFVFR